MENRSAVTAVTAVTELELERVLATTPFAKIYGWKIESVGSGTCTLRVPFQKELERPGGLVAGAIFIATADVAIWLAIMTVLGVDAVTVTTELNTTFIGSARNEDVLCTARLLKVGKSLIHGVAQCTTVNEILLTHHAMTYFRK